MINKIKNSVKKMQLVLNNAARVRSFVDKKNDDTKNREVLFGKILNELHLKKEITSLQDVEFKIFSQWGDDGIIQYLISKLNITSKTFIEFGVETYIESNTRFLLINNNWSGMVIDGSQKNIDYIKNDPVYWFHEIYAKESFITKENINALLSEFPYGPEIGLLSIDIDGNDYWVWKEINVVNPIIVISEFNSVYGPDNPWTTPYDANYVRPLHTPEVLLYGPSLTSLCDLAEEKGYFFVGCNSAGNNAYFVRKDKIGELKPLQPAEGYTLSKFREYGDKNGRVSGEERLKILKGFTIYNTRTQSLEVIK